MTSHSGASLSLTMSCCPYCFDIRQRKKKIETGPFPAHKNFQNLAKRKNQRILNEGQQQVSSTSNPRADANGVQRPIFRQGSQFSFDASPNTSVDATLDGLDTKIQHIHGIH